LAARFSIDPPPSDEQPVKIKVVRIMDKEVKKGEGKKTGEDLRLK
jgi:hypothetical protein